MRRALQRLENALASKRLLAVDTLDRQVALPQIGTGARAAYDCAAPGGQPVDHGEVYTGA
jgi:hypothetical protein